MKPIYIVHMLRFGDDTNHSYIIGAFDKKYAAQKAGVMEEYWRGGKYKAVIKVFNANEFNNDQAASFVTNRCGGITEKDIASIKIDDMRQS